MLKYPSMKRSNPSPLNKMCFLLIIGSFLLAPPLPAEEVPLENLPAYPPPEGIVKEIIAIDILQLESGKSVRILGIESTRKTTVRRDALDYLDSEVKGKKVTLEYDKRLKDNVGRLMAYVFLDEGNLLNEELIWRGYAYAAKKYPCKKLRRFQRYEKAARKEKNGLWKGL
jgi:micrococcal nuclease